MIESQTRKSPAGTGLNRHTQNDSTTNSSGNADPLQLFLSRLDRVKPYGKGWRADCPTGHKTHGTLSVSQGDDGRVLMHCFAGCEPVEVLAAVGLTTSDLFTRKFDASPAARKDVRQWAAQARWAAALKVLALEADVVFIASGILRKGDALNDADHDRLGQACSRIQAARGVLA